MCICQECGVQFTERKNLYAHLRKIHSHEKRDTVSSKKLKKCGISCNTCGKLFIKTSNLTRHCKNVHGSCQPVSSKKLEKSGILCNTCGRLFIKKSSLIRHCKNVHRSGQPISSSRSRNKCSYENCAIFLGNYKELRNHLLKQHGFETELDQLHFESQSEFKKWKDKTEEKCLASYTLDTSGKLLADGSRKEYYNCHRSYNYAQKGKGIRMLKSTGTNKIGSVCPSRMEALIQGDGSVVVNFWMTHLGHTNDIGRIFLNKQTKAEIAGKLKEGVTFQHILDDIRDSALKNEDSQRILLLEKKDMHMLKMC